MSETSGHVVGLDAHAAAAVTNPSSTKGLSKAQRKSRAAQAKNAQKKAQQNKKKHEKKLRAQAKKYKRDKQSIKTSKLKNKITKSAVERAQKQQNRAAMAAARAEILLTEEAGFLEPEGAEQTFNAKQSDLVQHVDEGSAKKVFNLKLDKFGPYTTSYTANGRNLLIGGRKGHIAAFDWQTGNLSCEVNVGETVRDVQWLHNNTMFAVAQRRNVYLYNHQGTEINFLAKHVDPLVLDFLRYHLLLVSVGNAGYLKYHDVSVGKMVAEMRTRRGPCHVMRQNPYNAVMHLGHSNGMVTMWSPNQKEPLVRQLCHRSPIQAMAVDNTGNVMATAGVDCFLRLWDVRNFKDKPMYQYFTPTPASYLDFSARNCLAVSFGPHVQVWKDAHKKKQQSPYMYHHIPAAPVRDCRFCPFEDVLAIGHDKGIDSILVPGSGEPNFDAYEANPYETTKQRREHEVKQLLDKVPHELISLDPRAVLKPLAQKMRGAEEAGAEGNDEDEGEQTPEARKRRKRQKKVEKRYLAKNRNIRDARREQIMEKLQKEKKRKEAAKRGGKRTALDRFVKD